MWMFVLAGIIGFVGGIISGIRENKRKKERYKQGNFEGMFFENAQDVHSGRCEGDCSKCPAHYGYRYGRWYYGHDHSEGCEFGGNRCGGGL